MSVGEKKNRAWIVSVDMGYGHQRASNTLREHAYQHVITANSDKLVSERERLIWDSLRIRYEFISRAKEVPFIGEFVFGLYDRFQSIAPLFPVRDLSRPNVAARYFKRLILRSGLCRGLMEYIRKKDIAVIATHFVPALAAEYFGIRKVYCVVTDVDINRVWVPENPKTSTITYCVPARHTALRLREYGIPEDKIVLTGFPLPKENIGTERAIILKRDLYDRLHVLDPNRIFLNRHKETIERRLGRKLRVKKEPIRPLTVTYAVGGAGAQKEIGVKIVRALEARIAQGEVAVNLIAGTNMDIRSYFERELNKLGLGRELGRRVRIVYGLDKGAYFSLFNETLRTTDVLWTKPSELSFFGALGIPIVIAPPIGAHERYNKEWIEHHGVGLVAENPEYAADWLFYWLEDGRLAEAAWEGFTDAPHLGAFNIEKLVFGNAKT